MGLEYLHLLPAGVGGGPLAKGNQALTALKLGWWFFPNAKDPEHADPGWVGH